jgi:hypothetical protein
MVFSLTDILQAGCCVALLFALSSSPFAHAQQEPDKLQAAEIQRLGLLARTSPAQRDAAVKDLARHITTLARDDRSQLQARSGDFLNALLLVCDRPYFDTLTTEAVEAIDNALESVSTLEEIASGTKWEPFAYLYGFFNHDVTVQEIKTVADRWNNMSDKERSPLYPSYVHAIDVVCKPLSMGGLSSPEKTTRALEIAVPLLKAMYLQTPKPGTAFHPPSHAALVLGPLYERWQDSLIQGPIIRKHLGAPEEFSAMMRNRLIGSLPDTTALKDFEYGYYAYIGQYLANALARINDRQAIPFLRKSMEIYKSKDLRPRAITYTHRALIALGDEAARSAFETDRDSNPTNTLNTAVWLCRNGRGETQTYGQHLLGELLGCDPDRALETYFIRELEKLKKE